MQGLDLTDFEACERIAELEAERDEALSSAQRLATAIYEANYRSISPAWECGGSLPLVISQISNMVAGINTERDQLRKDVENITLSRNAAMVQLGLAREQVASLRALLELAQLALSKREAEPQTETRSR